jgi:hypothetical protein
MATSSAVSLALGLSGLEDSSLTINPEVSFWRTEKPRHTHFVIDYQTVEHPSPAYNKELSFDIPKNFDLIRRMTMVMQVPKLALANGSQANARYIDDCGRGMFEYVRLMSGTSTINTLYPELEHALEELQVDPANQWGQLTGKCDTVAELVDRAKADQWFWYPLNFYMTACDGDALPYVNMIGSGLTVKAKVRPFSQVWVTVDGTASNPPIESSSAITKMYLLNEVVLLNDEERALFARADLMLYSYQNYDLNTFTTSTAGVNTFELQFNHPIKDIIVMIRKVSKGPGQATGTSLSDNAYFDFSGEVTTAPWNSEAFLTMKMKLNGNDFWAAQDPWFFRKYLALTRYGRIPRKHIYPVPASLYPASEKPSGHWNFSKVDKRHLVIQFPASISATDVLVFSRHWNQLKFERNTLQVLYA